MSDTEEPPSKRQRYINKSNHEQQINKGKSEISTHSDDEIKDQKKDQITDNKNNLQDLSQKDDTTSDTKTKTKGEENKSKEEMERLQQYYQRLINLQEKEVERLSRLVKDLKKQVSKYQEKDRNELLELVDMYKTKCEKLEHQLRQNTRS
eukprot:gb/GECH01012422.1/.p1 GENE.gb/GECH01012422.1/~~gb/GECH01012422.1/.p1  ORF type:complete len:150 (+),score=48.42 gb/GECH01012422.1/:1-450(+)